jgi:hypothetical protein
MPFLLTPTNLSIRMSFVPFKTLYFLGTSLDIAYLTLIIIITII